MLDKAAPIWTPTGRCGLGEATEAAEQGGGDTSRGGGGATSADPKMAAAASFSSVEFLLT